HDTTFYGAAINRTTRYTNAHTELDYNMYGKSIIAGQLKPTYQELLSTGQCTTVQYINFTPKYKIELNAQGVVTELPANHHAYYFMFLSPGSNMYMLYPFESFDSLDKVPSINDYYHKWQIHFPNPFRDWYAMVSAILIKQDDNLLSQETKIISLEKPSGFEFAGSSGGSSSTLPIDPTLTDGVLLKQGIHIVSHTVDTLAADIAHKLPHDPSESIFDGNLDEYHINWDKALTRGVANTPTDDTLADGVQSTTIATKYLTMTDFAKSYNDMSDACMHFIGRLGSRSISDFFNSVQANVNGELKYVLTADKHGYKLLEPRYILHNQSSRPIKFPFTITTYDINPDSRLSVGIWIDTPPTQHLSVTGTIRFKGYINISQSSMGFHVARINITTLSDSLIIQSTKKTIDRSISFDFTVPINFTSDAASFYQFGGSDTTRTDKKYITVELVAYQSASIRLDEGYIELNPVFTGPVSSVVAPTDHVKFLFPYLISEYNTSATTGNMRKGVNLTNIAPGDLYIFLRYYEVDKANKAKGAIRGIGKIPGDNNTKYPIVNLETVDKVTSIQPTLVVSKPRYTIYKITLTQAEMGYRISVRFTKPKDNFLGDGVPDFAPATILDRHYLKCALAMVSSIPEH
ncbi:MAG: hypothetical protein ACRCX2_27830, partial [Paraclostridium sp.]